MRTVVAVVSPASIRKRLRGGSTLATIEKLRFLIVDDNIVNRKITQRMLESLGCASSRILLASNGAEALHSHLQQMADIVLMYLNMPVMDGKTATRAIRQTPPPRTMKKPYIIALTACAFEDQRQACLEAGMNAFLSKPIRIDWFNPSSGGGAERNIRTDLAGALFETFYIYKKKKDLLLLLCF